MSVDEKQKGETISSPCMVLHGSQLQPLMSSGSVVMLVVSGKVNAVVVLSVGSKLTKNQGKGRFYSRIHVREKQYSQFYLTSKKSCQNLPKENGIEKIITFAVSFSHLNACQPALGGHFQPVRWEPDSLLVTISPVTEEGAKINKSRAAGRRR